MVTLKNGSGLTSRGRGHSVIWPPVFGFFLSPTSCLYFGAFISCIYLYDARINKDIQSSTETHFFNMLILIFMFYLRLGLYSPGWSGTPCVDQESLEFTEIYLPLLPKCWN